tara:strand:- start:807 stop:1109 length:303 start_codon:yes stop_codon:yes gene_type:complete
MRKGDAQEEAKNAGIFKHLNKPKPKPEQNFGGNLKLPGQKEDNADRNRADELIAQMKNVTREPGTFTVYAKSKEDKEVTLADFDIIKVIGKGSFGKVFLV